MEKLRTRSKRQLLLLRASVAVPSPCLSDSSELQIGSFGLHFGCVNLLFESVQPLNDSLSILLHIVSVIFVVLSALSQFPYTSCQVTETVVHDYPLLFYNSANVSCVRLHSVPHLCEFLFHDLQDVVAFVSGRIRYSVLAY